MLENRLADGLVRVNREKSGWLLVQIGRVRKVKQIYVTDSEARQLIAELQRVIGGPNLCLAFDLRGERSSTPNPPQGQSQNQPVTNSKTGSSQRTGKVATDERHDSRRQP